jgi:hypothetical protein
MGGKLGIATSGVGTGVSYETLLMIAFVLICFGFFLGQRYEQTKQTTGTQWA